MSKIVGVHIPDGIKNYAINGDMRIAQRGTTFSAVGTVAYTLDRWQYIKNGTMVHTVTQDTDVPSFAQSGYFFQSSFRANLTTPQTSIGVNDYTIIRQAIEGYNWTNLAQKTFSISFWVKATTPGVYSVSCVNSVGDRAFASEYTINGASTWEKKTLVVTPSPTAGTWDYVNGVGLYLYFTLAAGTNFKATAGSWVSSNTAAGTNQINGVNTGATDFRFTGVMVNESSLALPFQLFSEGNFQSELSVCQRYFEKTYPQGIAPSTVTQLNSPIVTQIASSAGNTLPSWQFKVVKRVTPTMTTYNPSSGATGSARDITNSTDKTTSIDRINDTGVFIIVTAGASAATTMVHATADAEL